MPTPCNDSLSASESWKRRTIDRYAQMAEVRLHYYVSTYCLHELHDDCRLACKHCGAPCLCPCHVTMPKET